MLLNKNDKNDINAKKRNFNKEKLNNKLLDYDFKLDKQQLKSNKKIKKIEKDNDFKYREVEVKCNIKSLALKAGYTLGKICIVLTFISCLLTFGGNIEKFICNIPLTKEQSPDNYTTWTRILSVTRLEDGTFYRQVEYLRFNWLTTAIYIPFLIGMQSILYQISLTIYIIKTKFKQYYAYALILQYSMLFYSVYSNYIFLSYYVNPNTFMEKIMCFIPSLLLDMASIFFLSLSMRMKTLNFDEKQMNKTQNLLIKGLRKMTEKRNKNKKKIPKKTTKFKLKNNKDLDKIITKKIPKKMTEKNEKDNLNPDKIIPGKMTKKMTEKMTKKNEKRFLKNEKPEIAVDLETVNNGNEKKDIIPVKNPVKKKVKNANENISTMRTKKATGNATNKLKNAELKRVKIYIEKLKIKGTKKVVINDLKSKCKIDKNRWLEIKQDLIKEDLIYVSKNGKITYINQGGN